MSKEKCEARDPYNCRFHGARAYKYGQDNIEGIKKSLNSASSYNDASILRKSLAKAEAELDATAKGFKLLTKEFERARKKGTVETQAYLASRLKKASDLRLNDGRDWQDATRDSRLFLTKVLEASAKSSDGTIKIPVSFTGTQNIGELYKELNESGLVVTKLEVHAFNHAKVNTPEKLKEVEQKAFEYLRDPDNSPGHVFDAVEGDDCAIRGLSFLDKSGREFKVVGSWDV